MHTYVLTLKESAIQLSRKVSRKSLRIERSLSHKETKLIERHVHCDLGTGVKSSF